MGLAFSDLEYSQTTDTVVMIKPSAFAYNPQTAETNVFQKPDTELPAADRLRIAERARAEFEGLRNTLETAGVNVIVFDDSANPHAPDAIFPNNWFSTHHDGAIVTYPMQAENRRSERRHDILHQLIAKFGYTRVLDLSPYELQNKYLEGTGSLALDRKNGYAYAGLSSRTMKEPLRAFAEMIGYEVISFAMNDEGREIYHTNVMMTVGEELAIVCLQAITEPNDRRATLGSLLKTGHDIVEITLEQMRQFAGNVLELKNKCGKKLWVMSTKAHNALTVNQIQMLKSVGDIVHSPLDTIETFGGGGARCMLAEVFLP